MSRVKTLRNRVQTESVTTNWNSREKCPELTRRNSMNGQRPCMAHGADADRPVKCHSDLSERIKDEHKTSWANPPDSISISKTEMPS